MEQTLFSKCSSPASITSHMPRPYGLLTLASAIRRLPMGTACGQLYQPACAQLRLGGLRPQRRRRVPLLSIHRSRHAPHHEERRQEEAQFGRVHSGKHGALFGRTESLPGSAAHFWKEERPQGKQESQAVDADVVGKT
eukprot:scaffold1596_cov302-Pinguiococcus_pyrenoidosus.AAC.7